MEGRARQAKLGQSEILRREEKGEDKDKVKYSEVKQGREEQSRQEKERRKGGKKGSWRPRAPQV